MPAAARVGDQTSHGTSLGPAIGSQNVIINGKPAWRAGVDFHSCPLFDGPKPHIGGIVTSTNSTVLINGLPAARSGDMIVEAGTTNTIISGSNTVIIG